MAAPSRAAGPSRGFHCAAYPRPLSAALASGSYWSVTILNRAASTRIGKLSTAIGRSKTARRGVFAPELENNQYYAATLGAKIPMPDRVDVTMEMWAPQEIGYEIKLNNDQTRQSLIALLIGKLGLDFNRGERGYSIVTQLGAGNWQEASSRRGEFEVGRKYKIRAVRDAGRWRMFVDDQLMLESDAAEDLSLPELRLQGSQGKAGDVVYLDNVEIRTPVKTGVREGEWPVILADDFEREEIGPDWREANGSWSIENGAARGTFDHENGDENALIFAATLEPATLMPAAVEVSYDCWSPSAIVVETVLRDPQWTSGLCAAHIGKTGALVQSRRTGLLDYRAGWRQ